MDVSNALKKRINRLALPDALKNRSHALPMLAVALQTPSKYECHSVYNTFSVHPPTSSSVVSTDDDQWHAIQNPAKTSPSKPMLQPTGEQHDLPNSTCYGSVPPSSRVPHMKLQLLGPSVSHAGSIPPKPLLEHASRLKSCAAYCFELSSTTETLQPEASKTQHTIIRNYPQWH